MDASPTDAGHRPAGADRGLQRPSRMPLGKYLPYEPIGLEDRTWPGRRAERAPLWCSVDLRDGNQALIEPMDVVRKRRMFDLLVSLGFKEIEVGYPTSSQDDHDFLRHLIDTDAIPDDVVIQVMAPIRGDFIARTVKALEGAPRAVVQIFNPTSEVQRRVVFRADREQTRRMALDGAEQLLAFQESLPGTELFLQYAPESYTQTEPDFALDVCNSVLDFWAPRARHTFRINLPATVEVFPPQEYADRIEYMSRNLAHRDRTLLSAHPHNDRGSGVAAAEMAVLAGADRVEGTLFGNGERTGNVCLVTLAMNLFSQGVDPMVDLSDIDGIRRVAEECTRMPVPARHPWAGDFVYTSFAGTHQDAIAKGLKARQESSQVRWDVPYLPIDPRDIGRDYQALIRINTQSGKGGIVHLLRTGHGLELPRRLQIDFAAVMQKICERTGGEITAPELWAAFQERYVLPGRAESLPDPCPPSAAATATGGVEEWFALARTALDAHGLEGHVQEVTVQGPMGGRDERAAYCEIGCGPRAFWGVGIDTAQDQAVRAAVRSAVHRMRDYARDGEPRLLPGAGGDVRARGLRPSTLV
ncbi:2-isopropylmalate synthase [Streptomyces sp. NBRC 110028]|uniref:2-isopropylmalate synthase n=1 Tax=Streptomyces sp. NBRC 110028 TaxID=1621260 RepID=UPI0006E152BD|nr:2-isopropylmalate synthase [Streptomyces sp. NBRC 110028]